MLTINDLSASKELDRAAMTAVRGGNDFLSPLFGITNAPVIDAGTHVLAQAQAVDINQSGSLGGFNAVGNYQNQFGVSGQFVE